MYKLTVISLFVAFSAVLARPEDTYGDEFDNIDIDDILDKPRLVDNYMICFKTGQKCTPEGLKIRGILPDALKTKCSKCSPLQKSNAMKILEWAVQNRSDDFLELETLFDSEHQYRKDYADELKSRNIVLPALKQ